MSANMKWNAETTIKFIQLYKLHQCLWNFKSPEYKIRQKRDAAYNSIVKGMNITGFGMLEVKNKIKNLRSTYLQEIKKIQESKKSGAGLSNVYTSNIKWLKEMEEVFSKDLNKNVYENDAVSETHQDSFTLPDSIPIVTPATFIEDWNTAGTSSQPTVVPLPSVNGHSLYSMTTPAKEVWKQKTLQRKKNKKRNNLLKTIIKLNSNAKQYARERDRVNEEMERERLRIRNEELRQREAELQLQREWFELMKQGMEVFARYMDKKS